MATQALAKTDATEGGIVKLQSELADRAEQFAMVLPSHISPAKFQRTVLTAVQSDPDLLTGNRRSLLTACMKAAQDGLLPDKREAALVIFNNRVKDGQGKWSVVKEIQYMPMVYGLRKKILQSGEVKDIFANVVYKQEIDAGLFIYEEGTERMLRHKPMLDPSFDPTDEDIACAYSIATFEDGSQSFEVMRRSEINKVRQKSQTGATGQVVKFGERAGQPIEPKGPWVDWFSEMAKKTVMRRHSKVLPMSGDLIDVEAFDQAVHARSTKAVLAAVESTPPQRIEDHGNLGNSTHDVDEEVERNLDANFDPKTGEVIDTPIYQATVDIWLARLDAAQIVGDVLSVEGELRDLRDSLPDDVAADVEAAIADTRARIAASVDANA